MKPLHWVKENEFLIDGIRFVCMQGDYSRKSGSDHFVLLKDAEILGKYFAEFSGTDINNVLEFGVFQGGSSALFTLWLDLKKFVGIDISPPVPALEDFSRREGIKGRIQTYYGVSQDDALQIKGVVEREFSGRAIDLIIDDASHHYALSKKTFEIAFPLLKAGGSYVIEDWGWAHWPGNTLYRGETALSKLVLELVMLCGARRDLVAEVKVYPWFVVIKKGNGVCPEGTFQLDRLTYKRGIEVVGEKDLSLANVFRLIAARLFRIK